MSRITRLGVTAVSALVLAAFVGAATASAFTVWQEDGTNVTGSVRTSFSGTLDLTHSGGLGGAFDVRATCAGNGTVRPGGAGTVDLVACSGLTTISGTCASPRLTWVNLSWSTQLSGSRDDIAAGPGGGKPGWTMACSGFSGSCTGATSTAVANAGANVLATFDASSASMSCTDFGTATAVGTWTMSVAGHALSVA